MRPWKDPCPEQARQYTTVHSTQDYAHREGEYQFLMNATDREMFARVRASNL